MNISNFVNIVFDVDALLESAKLVILEQLEFTSSQPSWIAYKEIFQMKIFWYSTKIKMPSKIYTIFCC